MPVTGSTALPDTGISADDREFLGRFEGCELPEREWTHLAHIRVAWVCLGLAPAAAALDRIRHGIRRYNTEVLGRPAMYHETVTEAYTRLIADRRRAGESWQGFAARIGDLTDRKSPVLLRYYSRDRLFSDAARATFVAADLEDLPALTGDA